MVFFVVFHYVTGAALERKIENIAVCPDGFWGENCQLDRCEAAPCVNNGKCLPGRNDLGQVFYQCKCPAPFGGDFCQNYGGHDISRTLTDDCPGQGLYVFNETNKDDTKEIVIPQSQKYVNYNMECWWYISTTLNTGKLELSFSNFESQTNYHYLKVLKGSSTGSPQLHMLTGSLGAKKITWTDSFVSIYWKTDTYDTIRSPMTGYLRYKP